MQKNKAASVPKVAVVTRTKDRGLLLERAIQSVHNQTMTDFVHVIINDSGDPKIVDDLVAKYKQLIAGRVKVIHNATSHGMEAASNKAIKSVNSTYIAIHDDDDTWHPAFLEKATQHLDETGLMGVVVTTDRVMEQITDDKVEILGIDRWLPDVQEINLYKQCLDNYMTPITFLYRRSAYDTIGYYDESLQVCGDWDFGIRFLMKFDVAFLQNEPALANYHHRPTAVGVNGNSVFAGANRHRHFLNLLMNKYLRQDIEAGRLGVGYIMNSLRYGGEKDQYLRQLIQETGSGLQHRIDKLEGRLESTENSIKDYVSRRTSVSGVAHRVYRGVKRRLYEYSQRKKGRS